MCMADAGVRMVLWVHHLGAIVWGRSSLQVEADDEGLPVEADDEGDESKGWTGPAVARARVWAGWIVG